jgi:peptidylprolyl isomerase
MTVAQTSSSGPAKVTGKGHTTADDLQYWDLKVGDGPVATPGKKVTVNYAGYLTNGKKFDSSYDHGTPFQFTLGNGEVIKGWDEGVAGMKVGGRRQLKIPATLGYGSQGVPGAIPPNATLIFDVELLGVSGGK